MSPSPCPEARRSLFGILVLVLLLARSRSPRARGPAGGLLRLHRGDVLRTTQSITERLDDISGLVIALPQRDQSVDRTREVDAPHHHDLQAALALLLALVLDLRELALGREHLLLGPLHSLLGRTLGELRTDLEAVVRGQDVDPALLQHFLDRLGSEDVHFVPPSTAYTRQRRNIRQLRLIRWIYDHRRSYLHSSYTHKITQMYSQL